jgi:hypothetical protein
MPPAPHLPPSNGHLTPGVLPTRRRQLASCSSSDEEDSSTPPPSPRSRPLPRPPAPRTNPHQGVSRAPAMSWRTPQQAYGQGEPIYYSFASLTHLVYLLTQYPTMSIFLSQCKV